MSKRTRNNPQIIIRSKSLIGNNNNTKQILKSIYFIVIKSENISDVRVKLGRCREIR